MNTKLALRPVERGSADAHKCPVRDVLDCVGDRWSLLTLLTLDGGTLRFTEVKRAIGDISQRMLAQTLRTLERDGYVSRRVYATVPPKVEYTLTALGRSLLKHMEPLLGWAQGHHGDVRAARKRYTKSAGAEAAR